jgi:hypothetical protein
MISTWPVILSSQIFIVNPSGYCGATRKINHTGRKNAEIRASDDSAKTILENLCIFFMLMIL